MTNLISWIKGKTTKSSDGTKEPQLLNGTEKDSSQEQETAAQPKKVGLKYALATALARLPGSHKPLYRRAWFWASLGLSGSLVAVSYVWWASGKDMPATAELYSVVRGDTITIKAADGTILQQQGPATREPLKMKAIPKALSQAFIASEDRRFYQHHGVDYQGILRATVNNMRSAGVVEGGSTITQQLTRILFLNQEKSLWRKLREVRLSQKVEHELTKDQILERYLNVVYLGSGAYGIADAAWVYFSKSVDQLTIPEMATIAGLAPAPSLYSPAVNPEAAKQRRNIVLRRMQEDGVITASEKALAVNSPLEIKLSLPKRLQVQAPYFTTYIQKELPKYVPPEVLEAGGLTVETTLIPNWQTAAENAVAKTVKESGRSQNFQQASLVAIDPKTGEIKAMVGGKDFGKNQFNRVTQAQRQPGSTFKGFVYATAIATGKNPDKEYVDAPFVVEGYEPKNYSPNFHGSMTIRDALTHSVNIVAVKALMDVGFNPTIKLAHDMGIKSPLKPTYSLALGSSEVNLLELTSAYGTFATQGLHAEAHGIRRIFNRQGKQIWSATEYKPTLALDPDSTAIMTGMLRNVVTEGTGRAAQLGDRPVAGKTGTSDESRDLWFVGFVPQLVAGVWLGNDNNESTWGASSLAADAWHEFMAKVVTGMPVEKFPEQPKLEGRKATIKAEPVKGKRIHSRPIPSNDEEQTNDRSQRQVTPENSDEDRPRRSSRQVPENSDEERPRRSSRQRSDNNSESQSHSEDSAPRRRRSDQSDSESTPRVSRERSGDSNPPERRHRDTETPKANPPVERVSRPQSESRSRATPTSTPSWRERLAPKEKASNSPPSIVVPTKSEKTD